MSPSDVEEGAAPEPAMPPFDPDLARRIGDAVAQGAMASLSNEDLQQLMSAAVHVYAARVQGGDTFRPFPLPAGVTATDVMVTSTAMLKSVGLQLFELGMWQAWSGNF